MDKETIWEVVGVIAFDVEYDLVVLKLSGEGTPLPLGNSDVVQRGEPVVAVGYPGGKYKVTTGNVHGIRNSDKLLGTTAEISNGNSGGPLLNDKGKVIGINTRSEKYSFAVPSNILKELLTRSVSPEPLTQWQKRNHIRAYVYHHEGENRFNAGDYAKAIINFDNAIQQNPKHIRAYFWRGQAKYSLGKSKADQGNVAEAQSLYQAAIDDYTLTLKINPEFALAYNNRGWTQHDFGESKASQGDVVEAQHLYQAAIDDYTHSIKIDPKYTFPYFYRGLTRREFGKLKVDQRDETIAHDLYEAAIQDYTQVIRLRSSYAMAYNDRGGVKYLLGKSKANQGNVAEAQQLYKAAIDDFTAAIKIDPKQVFAYKNRGNIRKLLGLHEMAEQDFAKAKELESDR
jgi:tetratricopeptide (TPR) repeat protein